MAFLSEADVEVGLIEQLESLRKRLEKALPRLISSQLRVNP